MTTLRDERAEIPTSLGPAIEFDGELWQIDLTPLPVVHGLSVLSRALGEMIVDQATSGRIDINVERSVRPTENPELLRDFGITLVKVCAERETIAGIADQSVVFQDRLRALLGTLQRRSYREALIPVTARASSKALVFEFSDDASDLQHRFVLELVRSPDDGDSGCLRVTIEDPEGRHIDLGSIPHLFVEGLDRRKFIAGSTRISQTWSEGIRREAERGRRSFIETRRPDRHLFSQFEKAELSEIEQVSIFWGSTYERRILELHPGQLAHQLKRVLLALEDVEIRHLLASRQVVRIDGSVYVDISNLGRVLNLSLGQRREQHDVDTFLSRMPVLTDIVDSAAGKPLADVKIFLIHHITSEVLGLIAALRQLGCRDLVSLFVAYSGEAPANYLGALLDLPPDEFDCMALMNVPDDESVEGHYVLSPQYSDMTTRQHLAAKLSSRRLRYFDAMQTIAVAGFLQQLERAEKAGQRCLIIEDGGYLMPLLNRACLEHRSVADMLTDIDPGVADDRPLHRVLDGTLIGGVEHTRNGFDRLQAVESEFGALAFPAFSIAISHLKIGRESREVATSILNAVENVLHADGKILSLRHCLVLGCRGAIGSSLVTALGSRLAAASTQLMGVDLRVGGTPPANPPFAETRTFGELPQQTRRRVDLILGVIGHSILTGPDVEDWLLHGEPRELILASGSTKTEEFSELADWTDRLLRAADPHIGDQPVALSLVEQTDPITGRVFGHRYRFAIGRAGERNRRLRDLVFLANLTPVNFMFYGVPTELIDPVLGELLGCAIGIVGRTATEQVPPQLLAVDRDITATGDPL